MATDNRPLHHRAKTITLHAISRFAERFDGHELISTMQDTLRFGNQWGNSELHLATCGAVFVYDPKSRTIVTVLTKDQAIANAQAMGPPPHK